MKVDSSVISLMNLHLMFLIRFYNLHLQVHQSSEGISICQQKYTLDLLQGFGMANCKPTPTSFQSSVTLSTSSSSL
jgi:hypothetical protein